jgi:hypothetical protein
MLLTTPRLDQIIFLSIHDRSIEPNREVLGRIVMCELSIEEVVSPAPDDGIKTAGKPVRRKSAISGPPEFAIRLTADIAQRT